jgi:hypothetical protein
MNSAYPGDMLRSDEFAWNLDVSVTHKLCEMGERDEDIDSRGQIERVTVVLKRQKIEGDWTWKVDVTDIVSILGLWMLDYHEQVREKEDFGGGKSLRILGQLDSGNEEFKLWMPAGLEYHTLSNTQVELAEMLIPEHRLFPRPRDSVGGLLATIVEIPPHIIFAQILYSMLLAQIADAISPINDVTARVVSDY